VNWLEAAAAWADDDSAIEDRLSRLLTLADEVPTEFTARRENGRRRPRGYAPWNPQRRTRELLGQVEEIIAAYEQHLPLTVRQIFYCLLPLGYPKTKHAYARLGEHLVRARRARLIDFSAIRDDGAITYSTRWHDGPAEFWDDVGGQIRDYSRDRQAGQRTRVELWCEAAGMGPQLARVADRYSVPVFSSGGFASLTAVRMIAQRALARNVPTILLHVGDFDPSGVSIFESMVADAREFVLADRIVGTLDLHAERVALTAAQVADYGLPTATLESDDTRSKGWQGGTCQLEALAPDLLAEIVEAAIVDRLDLERLEGQIEAEDRDRVALLRALPAGRAA